VVVYYPYQGGVSAQAITYKTSCAKSFLSRRASGDQLYEKSVFIKRDKSQILVPVSLTKSEQVRIDLIDKSGNRIKSVYQSRLAKGEHSIVVNAKNLQAGEYTAEVFVKGKKLSQHDITIQE
jgi:ribosomal protein S9